MRVGLIQWKITMQSYIHAEEPAEQTMNLVVALKLQMHKDFTYQQTRAYRSQNGTDELAI